MITSNKICPKSLLIEMLMNIRINENQINDIMHVCCMKFMTNIVPHDYLHTKKTELKHVDKRYRCSEKHQLNWLSCQIILGSSTRKRIPSSPIIARTEQILFGLFLRAPWLCGYQSIGLQRHDKMVTRYLMLLIFIPLFHGWWLRYVQDGGSSWITFPIIYNASFLISCYIIPWFSCMVFLSSFLQHLLCGSCHHFVDEFFVFDIAVQIFLRVGGFDDVFYLGFC